VHRSLPSLRGQWSSKRGGRRSTHNWSHRASQLLDRAHIRSRAPTSARSTHIWSRRQSRLGSSRGVPDEVALGCIVSSARVSTHTRSRAVAHKTSQASAHHRRSGAQFRHPPVVAFPLKDLPLGKLTAATKYRSGHSHFGSASRAVPFWGRAGPKPLATRCRASLADARCGTGRPMCIPPDDLLAGLRGFMPPGIYSPAIR